MEKEAYDCCVGGVQVSWISLAPCGNDKEEKNDEKMCEEERCSEKRECQENEKKNAAVRTDLSTEESVEFLEVPTPSVAELHHQLTRPSAGVSLPHPCRPRTISPPEGVLPAEQPWAQCIHLRCQ